MRLARLALVCAVALATPLAASPVSPAGADPAPVASIVTMSSTISGPAYSGGVVFGSPDVPLTFASPTEDKVDFTAQPDDPLNGFTAPVDLMLIAPDGDPFAAGQTYPIDNSQAGSAAMYITQGGVGCAGGPQTGSLQVEQATYDADAVTAFAATYSLDCNGLAPITGELRWQSDVAFGALAESIRSWDFGDQPQGVNGTPKTFTFTNRGTDATTLPAGAASLSRARDFILGRDTCSGASLAVGATCTVRIVPKLSRAVSGTYTGAVNTLRVTGGGVSQRVPLRGEGREYYPTYVNPGPEHIGFAWGALPGPVFAASAGYLVLRGTTPRTLTRLRRVPDTTNGINDRTTRAGVTYYYAVQPIYPGIVGDATPTVAGIAWPQYSAGMYHTLRYQTRMLTSRRISAGHPYRLKLLGRAGVPASRVAAVALEIHAASPSNATAVTVSPAGHRRPKVPDLQVVPGGNASNFDIAAVGRGGQVLISNARGTAPVTVDVLGYYSGRRLSTRYGTGGAAHVFFRSGIIGDTRDITDGGLPSGFYLQSPILFDPRYAPHVTSVVVQVTASNSTGHGGISVYASGHRAPRTTLLTFGRKTTSSGVAIVPVGTFLDPDDGLTYPSINLLNRGTKAVQLFVSILGYYDDNTLLEGQRYVPTAPVDFKARTLRAERDSLVSAYSNAGDWTTAFNTKIWTLSSSADTNYRLWPYRASPAGYAQAFTSAGVRSLTSTVQPLGVTNRFWIRSSAGTSRVSLWSFGRFEAFPVPTTTPSYAAISRARTSAYSQAPPAALARAPGSSAAVIHRG